MGEPAPVVLEPDPGAMHEDNGPLRHLPRYLQSGRFLGAGSRVGATPTIGE